MRGIVCIPFQLVSDPEETVSKSSLSICSAKTYVSSDVHKIKKLLNYAYVLAYMCLWYWLLQPMLAQECWSYLSSRLLQIVNERVDK